MVAVQTVSLTWQQAGELATALAVVGGAMALSSTPRVRSVGAFLRETAVIGVLYGLWQLAGELAVAGTGGAFERARWIQRFESGVYLPSELSVQHLILGHPLLIQLINLYYATMHFPMMFVFLIWLFVRHRDRYRPVRQVLAWTTLACLLVQLVPVAPPRMLPGFVDTAIKYGFSVYQNGFAADQLSAMPSVHVAWAVLVGYYAVRIGTSRWRHLAAAHSVLTIFVVVSTGNHWWLDGIVGVAVLSACAWGVFCVRTGFHAALVQWRVQDSGAAAQPVDTPLEPAAVPR